MEARIKKKLAQLIRKMDEQKEEINKKFEALSREMKEEIHQFDAKVEGSLGPCEQGLNDIGSVSLTASSSQGCVEGELDLGGTKKRMERETEEDLVEDMEDKGELDLDNGDEDDDLRDNLDDSTHNSDDSRDSTHDFNHRKIHFRKRKYECSLDVRNMLPCEKLFYEDGFSPSRKKKMKIEEKRKEKERMKSRLKRKCRGV